MSAKSSHKSVVRKAAHQVRTSTAGELRRLRDAMKRRPDTSDIPGGTVGVNRIRRDEHGQLPRPRESVVRDAVLAELGRRGMTRYGLWKSARVHCPTLPESAVYEFLRGQRQIGLAYVEAMLAALKLRIVPAAA